MTETPDACPKCGSQKVARILYGLPHFSEELERKLDAGEIVLGGCVSTVDEPVWRCNDCVHQWGDRC